LAVGVDCGLFNLNKLRRLEEVMATMGQIVAWDQLRSSGRGGSAIADALIAFGEKADWQTSLLDASEHFAEQAKADWRRNADAYDQEFFGEAEAMSGYSKNRHAGRSSNLH
jgi:hypothetical protein